MPRQRSQQLLTLTAAAKRIDMRDSAAAKRDAAKAKPWHAEAWGYYDEVPEIKESIRYRGNQLGKVRLFVAVDNPTDATADPVPAADENSGVPPEIAKAADAELERLRSRMGGQGEIMRMLDMNLEVVGECYLVGYGERSEQVPNPVTQVSELTVVQAEDWMIRSVSEVEVRGSGTDAKYLVKNGAEDSKGTALDPERDTIMRIWLRHPRWAETADCAMRALLGECRLLQVLCQQLLAHAYRALSAGIITIPNELGQVATPDPTRPEEPADDPLMDTLYEVLSSPIEDPTAPSTVQPGVLRGPGQYLTPDMVRLIKFYDPAQVDDIEKRISARVERIARGLNLPVEKIMGHQQCVTTDTQILTADGWKSHGDVPEGAMVLTLNHGTGLAEWQPVQRVSVFPAVDQPLLEMRGKSHSSMSTLNHRWPVMTQRGARRWYESADLNTNCRLIPGAPSADQPAEPKWSDALVELVAWYYTEGTDAAGGGALIYQSERANPAKVAMIRRALTDLAGPFLGPVHRQSKQGVPAWSEAVVDGCVRFRLNKPLASMLRVCAPDKVPTFGFMRELTVAQLELFIQRSVDGDGYRCPGGGFQFHQQDERRADAFEFACVLSGRAVSRSVTEGAGGFKQSTRHLVLVRRAATQRIGFGVQRKVIRYTGEVWCPTVDNGTWLARRNGSVYFTGNTTYANAAQVDEDEFNDYLAPSADTAVDALTFAFLAPQLQAAGVDDQWIERLYVWYDASDLIAQPDAEKNADAAHDRNTISNAAYRKAKGFSEDDAPEPIELLQKAGLRRGILTADLTHALLELMGIPIDVPEGGAAVPAPDAQATATAAMLMQQLAASVRPRALRAASRPTNDIGQRLTEVDRQLRTRLLMASNVAMTQALDRAANRLRTRTNGSAMRAALQTVPRRSWFAHLGPSLVAEAMGDEDPLAGAWDGLEDDFMAWGADAQGYALGVAGEAVPGDLSGMEGQQSNDLRESWFWLAGALTVLANERLWTPDLAVPEMGEFDPSLNVPAGLVRQAVARAGGATGLSTSGSDAWVTLVDGGTRPAGGIGTGELIRGALRDGGASIEAYRWQYGPAYRQRPFDPHRELDGQVFDNFDSDVLANRSGWPDGPFYMPGDHAGCVCDFEPIVIPAAEAA